MSQSKRVAVILSGCGHRDGSEITDAVSTLIALSEAGAVYKIFAPDIEFAVTDPLHGGSSGEHRQVLTESARIADASGFTARLTIDITPELRGRIKIIAFQRGVTVADMLRELLAREFPSTSGDTP